MSSARGFLSGRSALKYKRENRNFLYQTFLFRFLEFCLRTGRECAVEADIGVEGGVRVREAVEKGLAEGSVRLPLISAVGGICDL